MMSESIAIIDGTNFAYRAYYSHHKLKGVQVIYGATDMIRSFINRYRVNKLIVAWDGDRSPERLEIWPKYKAHREQLISKEVRKEIALQSIRTRKLLHYIGIPQIHNKNLEGDDIIHLAVKKYKKLYGLVRLVSGDKDMLQLVDKNVWIYNGRDGEITTPALFTAHTSLDSPKQYPDYLSLVGDKSDDIPGYMGIGPVKAIKFLNKYGSIGAFLKNKKARHEIMNRKELKEIYVRNRLLINLEKFQEHMGYTDKDITFYKGTEWPDFDEENFVRFCEEYRMKTFLMKNFLTPFKNLI